MISTKKILNRNHYWKGRIDGINFKLMYFQVKTGANAHGACSSLPWYRFAKVILYHFSHGNRRKLVENQYFETVIFLPFGTICGCINRYFGLY